MASNANEYRFKDGVMSNGHFLPDKNLARDGAAKKLTNPRPVVGHRSRIKPSHEFLHGQAVDDNCPTKKFQDRGNVETHPGMPAEYSGADFLRGTHDRQEGNVILKEAGALGSNEKPD